MFKKKKCYLNISHRLPMTNTNFSENARISFTNWRAGYLRPSPREGSQHDSQKYGFGQVLSLCITVTFSEL